LSATDRALAIENDGPSLDRVDDQTLAQIAGTALRRSALTSARLFSNQTR
jgi:hypothetical protein